MQDPRLRLLSVVAISVAAFSGMAGAVLAFLWWLFFSGGPVLLKRSSWPLLSFIPLMMVTAAVWATGGEWFSYLVRLGVVLLVAMYAYQDQEPGDFMKVCTWALGPRTGFDIGLAGEMAFGSTRFLEEETRRRRRALAVKGIPVGVRSIVPFSAGLVFALLGRSEEQADLLVARGYTGGGTACGKFSSSTMDVISSGIAVSCFILVFLPVREFFILVQ